VLIRSPLLLATDPVDWLYRPVRVDLLMLQRTVQGAERPLGLSDFFVTLYADDGSEAHNPGLQASRVLSMLSFLMRFCFFCFL
jgi:hypothetical protein